METFYDAIKERLMGVIIMGKITDALDKSEKERKPPVLQGKRPNRASEARAERQEPVLEVYEKANEINTNHLDKNLITILRPQTFEAEQFRTLKSSLLFPASGTPPRSVMVTSAVPGEGKSFVSANLAINIAQNINEHVLLMDCDIRKPTLHKDFGFGAMPGLSEYLSGKESLSSLLLKTHIEKLSLLPAGTPPSNPTELLSSKKMSHLIDEIRSRYTDRYIIIDTPPPKLASETKVIARQIDKVLVVARYGSTPRELVQDLVNMFGKAKVIGVVFNMCDRKSGVYGYRGYGRYSRYYKSYHE